MRYIGIDYGSKRIGVAISDDQGRIAFPDGVIMNRADRVVKEITNRIKKKNVDVIVVGLPIGLDGKESNQTQKTWLFIETLKKSVNAQIVTENEMLSSRMAASAGMKGKDIDASSAAIILQSYLDKVNTNVYMLNNE